MNLESLLQFLREGHGFTWHLTHDLLRGKHPNFPDESFCPLSAWLTNEWGEHISIAHSLEAACQEGMPIAVAEHIAVAADYILILTEQEQEIRQQLLAACIGGTVQQYSPKPRESAR